VIYCFENCLCCRFSSEHAAFALKQTDGSPEAAINWLTDHSSRSGFLSDEKFGASAHPVQGSLMSVGDVAISPQNISVAILSTSIQLCHFGPLMRFLRRSISMLDHLKSPEIEAIVSVAQKYQEFVPDLDKWVHIESSVMESVRPKQVRVALGVSPLAEPPPSPVAPRERPKRKFVPMNTVLFNHELPVVVSSPSDQQEQFTAPKRRGLRLVSNASSGVSPFSLIDVSSSEVQGTGLSPDDLQYLIDKKVLGTVFKTSVGSMQISKDALRDLPQKLTEDSQVVPVTIEKLLKHKHDQVNFFFSRGVDEANACNEVSRGVDEANACNEVPETRDEIERKCNESISYLSDIPNFVQEQLQSFQTLPLEQQPFRRVRIWRGDYVITDALVAWQKRLVDILTVREEADDAFLATSSSRLPHISQRHLSPPPPYVAQQYMQCPPPAPSGLPNPVPAHGHLPHLLPPQPQPPLLPLQFPHQDGAPHYPVATMSQYGAHGIAVVSGQFGPPSMPPPQFQPPNFGPPSFHPAPPPPHLAQQIVTNSMQYPPYSNDHHSAHVQPPPPPFSGQCPPPASTLPPTSAAQLSARPPSNVHTPLPPPAYPPPSFPPSGFHP
jgi:hypothetical protein